MKVLIIISTVFLLSFQLNTCFGQNAFERGNTKGKNIIYKLKGASSNNKKAIAVSNTKNTLDEKLKNNPPTHLKNVEFSVGVNLNRIFISLLGKKRIEYLVETDQTMLITFFVNENGKVLELEFILPKNTTITPGELEILEERIKKEVSFKLEKSETKGAKLFQLLKLQRYKDLL